MVNLVGGMRDRHDSIRHIGALEMGSDIRILNVAWNRAVPSIYRGTSLVPLLFSRKSMIL